MAGCCELFGQVYPPCRLVCLSCHASHGTDGGMEVVSYSSIDIVARRMAERPCLATQKKLIAGVISREVPGITFSDALAEIILREMANEEEEKPTH